LITLSNEQTLLVAWQAHLDSATFDRNDNFFELGGDSLAALKIVNQLSSSGLLLSVPDFYEHPTFNGQLALLSQTAAGGRPGAENGDAGQVLPLAPLQPALMLDSLSNPTSTAYWMVSAHQFTERVSATRARSAWETMVIKNPALRTRFVLDSSNASQVVDSDFTKIELQCVDSLSLDGTTTLDDWCAEQTSQLLGRGLDVLVAGWFIAHWRDSADAEPTSVLVFAAHHALLDGWSLVQCLEDFAAAVKAPSADVPELRPSIGAYFDWREQNGVRDASIAYWHDKIADRQPAQILDFAWSSMGESSVVRRDGRRQIHELSASASARMAVYCAAHGVTQAALIAYLWSRVLARYQDGSDICVGLTVNIRPATMPDAMRLSGCLINVVPLFFTHAGRGVVHDVREVMSAMAEVTEHGHLSHPEICEAAGLAPHSQLFASTLVFQNFDGDLETLTSDDAVEPIARQVYGSGGTADPLSLTVGFGERTWLLAEWDESRYDGRVVQELLKTVAHFASSPDALDDINDAGSWVTPAEHSQAVLGSAVPERSWAIGEYLGTGADDAIAVEDANGFCTYAELRRRSQAMAIHLRHRLGLRPGDRVAFIGRRGTDAAAAICGAWQAGIAWCAVDSNLHPRRRRHVLDALRPDQQVSLDEDRWDDAPAVTQEPVDFAETLPADRPAYLVATSGSTGTPKVVALPAGGLAPLVDAWREAYAPGPEGHRVLQLGSWTSDVFLGDLLKALSTGGRLVVCPDELRVDMAQLETLIAEHRISLVESTPALVLALLRHVAKTGRGKVPSLRTLIVGSDAFRIEELEEMRTLLWPKIRLVNGYGLSECMIESAVYDSVQPAGVSRSGLCPIGSPLRGTEVDIVDKAGRRLPRGAIGEVRITGPGVGLGYLIDGELQTRGGFASGSGIRSYRTGDFGFIDLEGTIRFFGRRDSQVKIRGHRVEIGEIENALLRLEGVDEVHVRADGGAGSVALRAFIGSRDAVDSDWLQSELCETLPSYAIPQTIDVMARLPRTESGKMDRVALAERPLPTQAAGPRPSVANTPFIAPVKEIWESLLERPVDLDRSFFDSGGHSILVITLFERLRQRFGDLEFTVADLFRYPTITKFARYLTGRRSADSDGGADRLDDRMSVLRAVERGELTAQAGLQRVKELSR
jgi:amino acid adenylation domain-containing protein